MNQNLLKPGLSLYLDLFRLTLALTVVVFHASFPQIGGSWGIEQGFDHPLFRLAAAAAFLNEIWFWSITPLSNVPVWSLGFEAWFYALFGVFIFLRGWKRAGLVCLVGLIAALKYCFCFRLGFSESGFILREKKSRPADRLASCYSRRAQY